MALTEGTTPAGSQLSVTDTTASISQYGDFITLTDKLLFTTLDPVLMESAEVLGEQAGNSLDQICRDVIIAGTSVQYASTATARTDITTAMVLSIDEIREAVRTLQLANARPITQIVPANQGVGTLPVSAAYVAIIHPSTLHQLKAVTGFVPVRQYPTTDTLLPGEVGFVDEVRFVMTTNAKFYWQGGSSSANVFATLFLGQNAFGITRVSGEALRNIVKPLGSAGTEDPLEQRATSGWKATFVATRLQETFMVRVEHGNGTAAPIS